MSIDKTITTIYIDIKLLEIAKANKLNLSSEFNEFLKERLFALTTIPNENKKETLRNLIKEHQNKAIAFQNELKSLEQKEEYQIEEEEEELKKQMEDAMR